MKITQIDPEPLIKIPSINVAPGGGRTEQREIPVLHGRVTGLPPTVKGLLITSDMQGFESNALEKPEAERRLLGRVVVDTLKPLLGSDPFPTADGACRPNVW